MNNFANILTTIRRPFQQELRKGCRDDVVVNGLGSYVQLWAKNGDAFTLEATEKEVLNGLVSLFENYAGASPTDRQRTLEEATKQIDTALGGRQGNLADVSNTSAAASQKRQQPTTKRTSTKKKTQTEMLPLFGETENPSESIPIKPEPVAVPTTYTRQTEHLSLFGDAEVAPQQAESARTEEVTASVPISDTRVSTDLTSLDFLSEPLQYLKGIGPRRAAMLLAELNIETVGELLAYYPRDYIDRSKMVEIYRVGRAEDDEPETIQGKVVNHTSSPTAKGKRIGKISIYDGTGVALLVNFGRRIGIMKSLLPVDTEVVVSGKFSRRYNEIQATDYEFELFEEDNLIHTKRIVPKYALTAKLTAKMLRMWMRTALDTYGQQIPEILPLELRQRQNLMDRQSALNEIHFPTSEAHRKAAQKRLAFEEFFLLSVGMELKKDRKISQAGIAFRIDTQTQGNSPSLLRDFIDSLPYELTGAQKRVFGEIQNDMRQKNVMNRLIQGDVGSGKTVVAAMALLRAIENGYQGALMVPTEILAEQHYYNLSEMFESLRKDTAHTDDQKVNVVLLKSDLPKAEREEALAAIADGTADLIVGTQALIQEGVDFHRLGLVIIDEQHRFGVMQRATLRNKVGNKALPPDVLVMTATPIPRTLALTLYGDLNVSVIDEMPPGRQTIKTYWIKEKDREKLYGNLRKEIQRGRQAYVVYPLVEESEKLEELKAATEMAEHLQNAVFPDLRVGLLHGQMKSTEKQGVMAKFNDKHIDILVSTTVIEVGIDVPNATLMVIENAERFGLSQLHQLRGRVGRGKHQSACYLVATPKGDDSYQRIQAMIRTNNGFQIAEADLNIRGPGEFFGTRQSGVPNFKIANIIHDATLLETAKQEAELLVKADRELNAPTHQLLKRMLQKHWRDNLEIASVG
ncbi:ATP-dependent DNA helicase RecG [Candidatus Poribacteria bacterium]|nr:ATP-dependent DNA helicase RecG [Candidatus Poribacteria bacterium]MYK96294.1 ATP-dependent DNA helicase RecG [Candidatus Poribacteria bacterium]